MKKSCQSLSTDKKDWRYIRFLKKQDYKKLMKRRRKGRRESEKENGLRKRIKRKWKAVTRSKV